MRISDWSSDVCSSDLSALAADKGANLAGSRHAPTPMGPGDEPRDDGGVCIAARLSGATGRGSASIIPHRCPQRAIELVDRHVVDHLFARGDQFSVDRRRSEEHTSELQSLMRISYAVFCLKKKKNNNT